MRITLTDQDLSDAFKRATPDDLKLMSLHLNYLGPHVQVCRLLELLGRHDEIPGRAFTKWWKDDLGNLTIEVRDVGHTVGQT